MIVDSLRYSGGSEIVTREQCSYISFIPVSNITSSDLTSEQCSMAMSYKYQELDVADTQEGSVSGHVDPTVEAKQGKHGSDRPTQAVWFGRPSVFWLVPVFVVFSLAMGMTVMPRTNVIISLLCRKIVFKTEDASTQHVPRRMGGSSTRSMGDMLLNGKACSIIIVEHNAQCSMDKVESATAMLMLWGNLIAGIVGTVTAPLWGKVSDSGTLILVMALASSYAADCSNKSETNVALGWLHGSMFFGFAAGPVLGGYTGMSQGQSRPMLIFYVALAMRLAVIIFLILFVPESLPYKHARARPLTNNLKHGLNGVLRQTWIQIANPLAMFSSKFGMEAKSWRDVIALATVNTTIFGAFMGAMNVMLLYTEYTFKWGNRESGTYLSTVNFFRTLATVVVLPLAMPYLHRFFRQGGASNKQLTSGDGRLDPFLLRVCILSDVVGYLGYAVAPNSTLFTLCGALVALGASRHATSEASMTKRAESAHTGGLLARIVAPTIATLIYRLTVGDFRPLVFWGAAACFMAATAATFGTQPQKGSDEEVKEETVPLQETDP
ncbi:MAG: hypothetical protein LQ338_004255 [Usnochroma carphineum]|nr:MAG: hypothetical protein LQ338_004255 [Usnochroma carphineum]